MIGLVSRLASDRVAELGERSCRSVCSRPGSARVSVPLVNVQTTIQTPMTTSDPGPAAAGRRGSRPAAARRPGSTRVAGGGRAGASRSTRPPRPRRRAGSPRRRRCRPAVSSSTTRTGCVGGERRPGGLPDDRVAAASPGPRWTSLGPRVAHHPLQRQHVRLAARRRRSPRRSRRPGAPTTSSGVPICTIAPSRMIRIRSPSLSASGEVVGDEDHRLAELVVQPDDLVLHVAPDQRVERGERLVEEQQRRVVGQRPGQADALLHAAGELVGVGLLVARQARPGRRSRRPSRGAPSCRCRGPRGRRRRCRSPGGAAAGRSAGRPSRRGCGAARAARARWPPVMSWPSITTVPAVGSISRVRQRTSVDLPEPDRPITTKTSPGATSKETSLTPTTQPVFSFRSARDSSASGVPMILSALGRRSSRGSAPTGASPSEPRCGSARMRSC